jgi:hypothetical protein
LLTKRHGVSFVQDCLSFYLLSENQNFFYPSLHLHMQLILSYCGKNRLRAAEETPLT